MRGYRHFAGSLLIASLCATLPALAQEVSDPALLEAFEEIRDLGPNLNPQVIQRTGALFARLHENTEKGGVTAHRDLSYGSDPRNVMDIYTPGNAEGRLPAVVFIHGGGLTAGHKDHEASPLMYANIGTYFARNGMVGVNATYRLVPGITYPQGGEDMKSIVDWLVENAAEYHIDPGKIFFLCSSAGCTHVASLLFDAGLMEGGDPDIAGAIMLSGAYEGGNRDYYGDEPETVRRHSPMGLAEAYQGEPVPLFLMSAEYDPNGIETGTARLLALLCEKRDKCPRYTQVQDHNHLSINQHINTADERYSRQMLEFIREVSGD